MNQYSDKDISILLVEDDEVDVIGIKRAFKNAQIDNPIIRAKDGVEGLERLNEIVEQNVPCIVLLDINMPRMNGIEMLSKLRSDPRLTESVVFVLTTSDSQEDKEKAYQEHIAGYIVKSSLDSDYSQLTHLLNRYWKIVDLPVPRT